MLEIFHNKEPFHSLASPPAKTFVQGVKKRISHVTRFLFSGDSCKKETSSEEFHRATCLLIERLKTVEVTLSSIQDPCATEILHPTLLALIKKARGFQRIFDSNTSLPQQPIQIKRFEEFVEKTEALLDGNVEKNHVIQRVFSHAVAESNQAIQRDVRILSDYQAQKLEMRADSKKSALLATCEKLLLPFRELEKERPVDLSEFKQWKKQRDLKRQQLFNRVLSLTDHIL